MVIYKENSKGKPSLQEAIGLDDVIGLAGFKGYRIDGRNLYVENLEVLITGKLVLGAGSLTPQDVSFVVRNQAVLSFPSKNIKTIAVKKLSVIFFLNDGMSIEFIR